MLAGKVLPVLIVVALLIIAAGYYISYRERQSAPIAHLTSLQEIQGVGATVCTYPVGAYGQGSGGVMYVANNELRVDVPDLEEGGYSGSAEAVIGLDGTRTIDPKSKQSLEHGGVVASALNMIITEAPWKCSPWWFSDSSLFTIPNASTL